MKAHSGIVSHSLASVKISDFTASEMHHSVFSVEGYSFTFSTDQYFDLAVGDYVIAAGTTKGKYIRAFSVYNVSTDKQKSCGVISNLFVAVFAAILGLFGMIITSVFLTPFSYVILIFTSVSVSCLMYRSAASCAAYAVVRWHRRNLKKNANKTLHPTAGNVLL